MDEECCVNYISIKPLKKKHTHGGMVVVGGLLSHDAISCPCYTYRMLIQRSLNSWPMISLARNLYVMVRPGEFRWGLVLVESGDGCLSGDGSHRLLSVLRF